MKKPSAPKVLLLALLLTLSAASWLQAEEGTASDASAVMTIHRFLTCQSIENREPVGETNTFGGAAETAYAFLEARDISARADPPTKGMR